MVIVRVREQLFARASQNYMCDQFMTMNFGDT